LGAFLVAEESLFGKGTSVGITVDVAGVGGSACLVPYFPD